MNEAPRHQPRAVARARAIARVLDDAYIDPIIGLIAPGIGDAVSSLLGLYIVGVAIERKLPAIVIARMLINLAIDAGVGAIPIAGDVFDWFYKAHRRNLALLTARHAERRASRGDWAFVLGAGVIAALALALPIFAIAMLVQWL